jgi:hypothetical protein
MELSPEKISDLARRNTIRKNQRELEAGTHNFLSGRIQREWNQKAVKNGTHHALGPRLNRMRLDAGTHNLLGSKSNLDRLTKGTHPSQMKRTCEHCDKTVAITMYARWHGNKCKSQTPTSSSKF